uniref:protein FAM92A-like isoform X1 n=2 Tax=Ciona intestinalis TaxID=7719 RepID=UPI000180D110|nr:protein FAM92A-like isoform X1 [Ciona intestinalis]|eukprot:XP_002127863.1 protein FAM92A-like isoform X1 [Ciona intestinalis]
MSFSKTPQTPEAREREAQSKFIEEAVQKVQKYFGLMCNEIGGICRKNGRLRDKYDDFAKTCMEYANVEQGPLKTKLTNFSENISAIQDYRQAQIERIEGKVLTPLTTYGRECKHTQNDLNTSFKARNRELKQHQQVEALRNKSPHDRHTITQAEAELQRRTVDVARTTQTLANTIDKFETKKIQDLKKIFSEFVKVEMLFHAKALELYTNTYNALQTIDEEEHIEMFRNNLRPATAMNERLDIAQSINPGANDKNRPVTTMERTRLTFQDSNRHEREQGRSEEEEEEESEEEEEYDSEENDDDDYEDEEDEVEELKTPQPRRVRTKPW